MTVGIRRRRALSQDLAEELSADSSYDVRLEAILALVDMDFPVSDKRARESLVQVSQRGLGLSGLFGSTNYNDTSRYDMYEQHVLRRKSLPELEELDAERIPHESDAFLAACEVFPRVMPARLREAISDGFLSRFNSCLEALQLKGAFSEKSVKDTLNLREFSCRRQTQAALDILCAQMREDDLDLIRGTLDRMEIDSSPLLTTYLGRYGDWADIGRLQKLKAPPSSGGGLLGFAGNSAEHASLKAAALYKIGRHRFVDLLSMLEDNSIKVQLIKLAAKKVIADLTDDFLLSLLNDSNDDIRKIISLRCLDCLKKARVTQLLERYLQQEYRFYSSIHWLDLGASMPAEIVSKIAKNELLDSSNA